MLFLNVLLTLISVSVARSIVTEPNARQVEIGRVVSETTGAEVNAAPAQGRGRIAAGQGHRRSASDLRNQRQQQTSDVLQSYSNEGIDTHALIKTVHKRQDDASLAQDVRKVANAKLQDERKVDANSETPRPEIKVQRGCTEDLNKNEASASNNVPDSNKNRKADDESYSRTNDNENCTSTTTTEEPFLDPIEIDYSKQIYGDIMVFGYNESKPSNKKGEQAPKSDGAWIYPENKLKTTTPAELDNRANFDGGQCPTGKAKIMGKCVEYD